MSLSLRRTLVLRIDCGAERWNLMGNCAIDSLLIRLYFTRTHVYVYVYLFFFNVNDKRMTMLARDHVLWMTFVITICF